MKRTTIRDIASYTGMSTTAVSLVLNNKPCKISEESRRKIFDAAKKLNYSPNQLAVGLITKRTRTLGLIVSDIANVFFSSLTKGVEQACQEEGWTIVLCNSGDSHARDLEMIEVLASRGVDGIIYCMSSFSTAEEAAESYELLKRFNLPFVEIDGDYSGEDMHNILFNNELGGYLATKHLIDMGHRHIACITGPDGGTVVQGRVGGYRRALQEADIPFEPGLLMAGNYTLESGIQAVDKLLGKTFTAVFSFNDMMAFGALKAFREAGIRVPDDVSLVGYDDVPMSELMEVPLTTVRQPVYEMGRAAAQKMIGLLENKKATGGSNVFEPELVIRKSVKKTVTTDG